MQQFASAYGRLITLILHRAPVDEQKVALRACVALSRSSGSVLEPTITALVVDGKPSEDPTLTSDLWAQLLGHAVTRLQVLPQADPGELLHLARALATEPVPGRPGESLRQSFPVASAVGVRIAMSAPEPEVDLSRPTPRSSLIVETTPAAGVGGLAYRALETLQLAGEPLSVTFERLDAAPSLPVVIQLLDQIAAFAETASAEHRAADLVEVLRGLQVREANETDTARKRAMGTVVRRFQQGTVLTRIVPALLGSADQRREATQLLIAAGENAADVVIDRLVAATERSHRSVYIQVLRDLPVAFRTIEHMLNDPRWYVVRNAAYLVGELHLNALDVALLTQRAHADERVRRAVHLALGKLATPKAIGALQAAVRDANPATRLLGAAALGQLPPQRAMPLLQHALQSEQDADVRAALYGAVASAATDDGVKLLIEAAKPGGKLFGRKPGKQRLPAVQALMSCPHPLAADAIEELRRDDDPVVRQATQAPARRTTSVTPLDIPAVEG